MERGDLDGVAELFQLASDGSDEAHWASRFQDHVANTMQKLSGRLRSGGGAAEQRLELLRARLQLHEIVAERLESGVAKKDLGLASLLQRLRAVNTQLVEEAIAPLLKTHSLKLLQATPQPPPPTKQRQRQAHAVLAPAAEPLNSHRAASSPPSSRESSTAQSGARQRPHSHMSLPEPPTDMDTRDRSNVSALSSNAGALQRPHSHLSLPEPPTDMNIRHRSNGSAVSSNTGAPTLGSLPPAPGSVTESVEHNSDSPLSSCIGDPRISPNSRQTTGAVWGSICELKRNSFTPQVFSMASPRPGPCRPGRRNGALYTGPRPHSTTGRQRRELNIGQLRAIITALFASKAEHNARCAEMKEPTETMLQHVYSFLSKRYTSPSEIDGWAQAIFQACQRLASSDELIAVLEALLHNTIPESFIAVQESLRTTSQALLLDHLGNQPPYRNGSEIERLWAYRSKNGFRLAECVAVVGHMYNERDAADVIARLHELAESGGASKVAEPGLVHYRDLMRVLTRFQLRLTEEFLADFVQLFCDVDSDRDGVVSHQQLEDLIRRAGKVDRATFHAPQEAEALALAAAAAQVSALAAARRTRQVTFSECVDMLGGLISARQALMEKMETVDSKTTARQAAVLAKTKVDSVNAFQWAAQQATVSPQTSFRRGYSHTTLPDSEQATVSPQASVRRGYSHTTLPDSEQAAEPERGSFGAANTFSRTSWGQAVNADSGRDSKASFSRMSNREEDLVDFRTAELEGGVF